MTTSDSRERFEKWWIDRYCTKWNAPALDSLVRKGERYANATVHEQWEAWQDALSAQAPSVAVVDLQQMHDRWVSENYGPGRMAKELRNLISKAGRDE
jgi:hypothetical protein